MPTLPEMLQSEIQRCRRVAEDCTSLGSSGAFAAALLQDALRAADAALKCRDLALIQQAIERLRGFRDVLPDSDQPTRVSAKPVTLTLRTPQGPRPLWVPSRPAPREQFFTWGRRAA